MLLNDGSSYRVVTDPAAHLAERDMFCFRAASARAGTKYVDTAFPWHRRELTPAQALLMYQFVWADAGTPEEQAQFLIDAIGTLRPNEMVMLDIEAGGGITDPADFTCRWLAVVEPALRTKAWVYVPSALADRLPRAVTGDRIVMAPRYSGTPDRGPVPWWPHDVHQYTDRGSFPGCTQPGDLSHTDLTPQQLLDRCRPEGTTMAWRVARSLDKLLTQLNAAYPRRSKASDGSIGDAAHATRASDHNPWVTLGGVGIVSARDFTHDVANGLDCERLYKALVASRDPRIKYIIWNKTITSGGSDSAPWVRRPYTGTNTHTKHLHLSVRAVTAQYDNTRDWAIGIAAKAPTTGAVPGDGILEVGDSGDDVRRLQEVLNRWYPDRAVDADGDFGPATAALVTYFQERAGLTADGVAGAATLRALGLTTPVTPVPVAPVTGAIPGDGILEVGDTGDAVRRLQEVLNRWYPDRKVGVDGDFGSSTKALVAYFQGKAGLTADGVAGPATLSALGLAGLR